MSTVKRLCHRLSEWTGLPYHSIAHCARQLQLAGSLPMGERGKAGDHAPQVSTDDAVSLLLAVLATGIVSPGLDSPTASAQLGDCRVRGESYWRTRMSDGVFVQEKLSPEEAAPFLEVDADADQAASTFRRALFREIEGARMGFGLTAFALNGRVMVGRSPNGALFAEQTVAIQYPQHMIVARIRYADRLDPDAATITPAVSQREMPAQVVARLAELLGPIPVTPPAEPARPRYIIAGRAALSGVRQ
jgi:hypothetical protein